MCSSEESFMLRKTSQIRPDKFINKSIAFKSTNNKLTLDYFLCCMHILQSRMQRPIGPIRNKILHEALLFHVRLMGNIITM